jgi:hypothetical protein
MRVIPANERVFPVYDQLTQKMNFANKDSL